MRNPLGVKFFGFAGRPRPPATPWCSTSAVDLEAQAETNAARRFAPQEARTASNVVGEGGSGFGDKDLPGPRILSAQAVTPWLFIPLRADKQAISSSQAKKGPHW